VHRLGVGAVLRRKLATTNPIESCLSTVQRVARNVKRWREGNQPLRWTAAGLLAAEKELRCIKGYQEILLLKERLNPPRIQQKKVRGSKSLELGCREVCSAEHRESLQSTKTRTSSYLVRWRSIGVVIWLCVCCSCIAFGFVKRGCEINARGLFCFTPQALGQLHSARY